MVIPTVHQENHCLDGRTGSPFEQPVLWVTHIFQLVHLVDDKPCSTGPYSLVTQQPLEAVQTRWSTSSRNGLGTG